MFFRGNPIIFGNEVHLAPPSIHGHTMHVLRHVLWHLHQHPVGKSKLAGKQWENQKWNQISKWEICGKIL